MSSLYNAWSSLVLEKVKEDLLDEVTSMSVDDFMTTLEDLKIEGVEHVDCLVFAAVEKIFEQRSLWKKLERQIIIKM